MPEYAQEATTPQQSDNPTQAARAEYAYKSKIGGQALVEGIMMKGAFRGAMACRLPNGEIDLETWDIPVKLKTDPARRNRFCRGIAGYPLCAAA